MNTEEATKVVALIKQIKDETMNASIYDTGYDTPMHRLGRIDSLAYEILHELKVEGYEH